MKKKLLMAVSYVLILALGIAGTVAYFTDREAEVNVFTVGDVQIELNNEFKQGTELMPGKTIENEVSITNTGKNDAWVWLTVELETGLPENILTFAGAGANWSTDGGFVKYGVELAPGETTPVAFGSVAFDSKVDATPNGDLYLVENGTPTSLGWNVKNNAYPAIYVNAYAIQADEQINTIDKAITYYNDQWKNNGKDNARKPVLVDNAEDLAAAIAAGNNVALTEDIALPVNGKALTVDAGKKVTLNLNGNDIIGTTTSSGASQVLFEVKGELTVIGDGTIALYDKSGAGFDWRYEIAPIYVSGGVANLNGGSIVCISDGGAMAYAADAVSSNSVININGSTLYSSYIAVRSFVTVTGKTNTINYNSGIVYGAKNGYDIWVQEDSVGTTFVNIADGINYIETDEFGAMYYIDDASTVVATPETLTTALAAGGEVVLVSDVALNNSINLSNADFVLEGNGHTITMADGATNTYALFDITGGKATIKNVTFDGIKSGAVVRTVGGVEFNADNVTAVNGNHTQVQGIFRLLGKSTITNCTFKNNTCNMVISLNYDGANNDPQVVKNCVFENNTCNATGVLYYVKGAGCTVDGNKFIGNTVNCNGNGATVYMGFTEYNTITNNVFENNVVNEAGTSKRVAGALMIGYEAVITNNAFIDNKVEGTNAKGNDVCASVYYTDIDLSGNYWGGEAPVENDNYFVEYPDNNNVIINDYLTTYEN